MFSRAVTSGLLTVSALALAAGVAYAGVVMDMVPVGDPGNAPDTRYATPGYGAVNYTYQIGKYEVTAGQYTEFLNDVAKTDTYGLYNTSMWNDTYGCKIQRSGTSGSYTYSVASDRADHPINFVSFWDSCRFVNWLQNGQPTGLQNASTTEDGAYTLNGYTGNSGISIQRNSGAKWFLPSDNEWYKAAFYDPGKPGGAGYWDYPIRSNTEPKRESPPGTDLVNGSWNVNQVVGPPYYTTKVGAYSAKPSTSAYGTYDQGGNQGEWCDTNFAPGDTRRVLLCACWGSAPPFYGARDRGGYYPNQEVADAAGIRVAALPQTYAILVGSRAPGWDNQGNEFPDKVRGDLDVDHVSAKLTWASQKEVIIADWGGADTLAARIQTSANSILPKVKAGDTLFFYYSGHGNGNSGAGVDEELNAVNGGHYLDDTLTSLLSDSRLNDVKKRVILDSCRSGGFWNNDATSGDNDLETLSNIAFLAAATEDTNALSDTDGTGLFTNSILPGLNAQTTFAQLANLAATAHSGNVTGFFKVGGYGTVPWNPVSFTSGFDAARTRLDGEMVPEPSALALLGVGAISLLAYAWRRRKRAA